VFCHCHVSLHYDISATQTYDTEAALNLCTSIPLLLIKVSYRDLAFPGSTSDEHREDECDMGVIVGLERYQARHPIPSNIGLSHCQYPIPIPGRDEMLN